MNIGRIFFVVNLAGGLAMGALLAYTFSRADVFYVSERYILAYGWIPAALAVVFCASLLCDTVVRVNVGLFGVGLAFAVFGADVWLAQWSGNGSRVSRSELARGAAVRRGIPFDSRTMMQVVDVLRTEGKRANPMMSPSNFIEYETNTGSRGFDIGGRVVLPMGSISGSSNVYCNEGGQWLVYESDEFGFQNPPGTWETRRANIALAGDSFAQGACNPLEAGMGQALRQRFRDVVNIGIGGSGPLLQFAAMQEYLPRIKPATVVWLHFEGNDMYTNLPQERRHPILQRYLNEPGYAQGLPELRDSIDAGWARFLLNYEAKWKSDPDAGMAKPRPPILNSLKLITLRDRFGLTSCPAKSQDFRLLGEIVEKADKLVRNWGGRLLFVYLPAWGASGCDLFDPRNRKNWLHDKVIETVSAKQVPILDLYPVFGSYAAMDSLFHYKGSHYSPEGYKLVSQSLFDALSKAAAR